jgi:hypothetical protein
MLNLKEINRESFKRNFYKERNDSKFLIKDITKLIKERKEHISK